MAIPPVDPFRGPSDWETASPLAEQHRPSPRRRVSHIRPSLLFLIVAAGILMLGALWTVRVESRLPTLRLSSQPSSAGSQSSILYPGHHAANEAGVVLAGPWVAQEIGSTTSLVSSDTASTLSFLFYGTDVEIITRIGPEAGRAYVTVDGGPAPGLPHDDRGSFARLRATQAEDSPITIATGLAHREHAITVSPGPQGELAVAGIDVKAMTPFSWAFLMLYSAIGALLFLTLRLIATTLTVTQNWTAGVEDVSRAPGRSGG